MKKYPCLIYLLSALLLTTLLQGEDRVIVVSSPTDLQQGLDLNAVAQVFKDSTDLTEFEVKLNDPNTMINNLDLNQDGQVDFIRVLEEEVEEGRLIILQAVLDQNAYSDIAYIDISGEDKDIQMQIRGESSLYGQNHYIVPRHNRVYEWPIIVSLYDPHYDLYHSPYNWDYYPNGWEAYNCIRIGLYRSRISYQFHSSWFRLTLNPFIHQYHRSHHAHHKHYRDHDFWDRIRRQNKHNPYKERQNPYNKPPQKDKKQSHKRDYKSSYKIDNPYLDSKLRSPGQKYKISKSKEKDRNSNKATKKNRWDRGNKNSSYQIKPPPKQNHDRTKVKPPARPKPEFTRPKSKMERYQKKPDPRDK